MTVLMLVLVMLVMINGAGEWWSMGFDEMVSNGFIKVLSARIS